MDKVTRLLEETQNLLEGFSSGTLSPVSSYYNSDSSEGESEEQIKEISVGLKFRNVLRKGDTSAILKFIENNFSSQTPPKKSLHICVEERCKDLEVFKALLRGGCDALELDSEFKTALSLLLEQKEEDNHNHRNSNRSSHLEYIEESNCLISTLLGEWELRRAATKESKIFKLIRAKNWKDFNSFLQQQESHQFVVNLLCKCDPKFAGISPLHEIAALNNVTFLKKISSKYPIDLNVKAIGSGNTLLHEAAHMSAAEMVMFLIESGARCDIKNAAGKYPAHLGTEQIQVIFEFKNLKSFENGSGSITESKESLSGEAHVHSARLTSGKAKSETGTQNSTAIRNLNGTQKPVSTSSSIDSLSREERKLKQIIGFLGKIEKHRDPDELEEEDDEGDDGNASEASNLMETVLQRESHSGRTVLHRYARRNQSERLLKFLKLHQTRFPDLFKVIDNSGHTPLHDAASEGSLEAAKIFLFGGKAAKLKNLQIDPSIPAELTGDTPLHAAAFAGNFEIVELLLSVGAKKDSLNIEGKRPVDVAASKNVRKLLLDEENTPNASREGEKLKRIKSLSKSESEFAGLDQQHQQIIVKRGPGRPRKYPRPDNNQSQSSLSLDLSSPSKQSKASHPHQILLPLPEILPDKLNLILLAKFHEDWLMLAEHFVHIFNFLAKKQLRTDLPDFGKHFYFPSESDLYSISKLRRGKGHLIEYIQSKSSSILSFISKVKACQILEKEFGFNLIGPFGYIDIPKLISTNNPVPYSGCPLKLKMKLANKDSSSLWIPPLTNFDVPKSPKSFSM